MTDLLCLSDLTAIEPPQENDTDMMFKVEAVEPPKRCPDLVLTSCTNTVQPQTILVS